MRKLIALGIIAMLVFTVTGINAFQLDDRWSMDANAGVSFNVDAGVTSDVFPYSFAFKGDLAYQLNDTWALVPLSFTFHKHFFDEDEVYDVLGNYYDPDFIESIPGELTDHPVHGAGNGFALTPGVSFSSAPGAAAIFRGQLGLGWHRESHDIEILATESEVVENSVAGLFAGGIEVPFNDYMSVLGQGRYLLIGSEDESTSMLGVTGGIKWYF